MDDLVSDRPGTRFAPRAIRAASGGSGPHLEAGIDAFEVLSVVDYGDAACVPAQPRASHEAITEVVGEVSSAGAFPIVLSLCAERKRVVRHPRNASSGRGGAVVGPAPTPRRASAPSESGRRPLSVNDRSRDAAG